jgi:hypothetical protein
MGGGPHAAPAGSTPPAARPDPPAAAPPASINGLSLFFSVLWERIRRLFGRG